MDMVKNRGYTCQMRCEEKNSECYVLNREDFCRIFKGNDEAWKKMLEDARTKENELVKRGFGFFPLPGKSPGLKNPIFIKKLNEYAGADAPQEMRPKNGIELRNILQVKAGIVPNLTSTPTDASRLQRVQSNLTISSSNKGKKDGQLHINLADEPVVVSSYISCKNTCLYTKNIIKKQISRGDLSEKKNTVPSRNVKTFPMGPSINVSSH